MVAVEILDDDAFGAPARRDIDDEPVDEAADQVQAAAVLTALPAGRIVFVKPSERVDLLEVALRVLRPPPRFFPRRTPR